MARTRPQNNAGDYGKYNAHNTDKPQLILVDPVDFRYVIGGKEIIFHALQPQA